MQKNILSTLAVMGGCILLFSSCEKREDGLVIDNSKDGKIFTATMPTVEETPESRTSTSDGRSVIWDEGDMISLLNGKNVNEKYRVQEGEGGKASTTLVKVTDSDFPAGSDATFATNIAYYPYGTVNYTGTGSNHFLYVTIPLIQMYAPNSFGKGAMPMVAVTASKDDDNLQFKNLFGLIKLQLKGSDGIDKIKSITIRGNKGEKLGGRAMVSCSNPEAPTVSFGGGGVVYDYIRLYCADGVAINEESATSFWIALPPTTFSEGISVTVELGDGCIVTKSTTSELTITRSMVTPMAALTFTRENAQLNVHDPAFRTYLLENVDMDNDGILTLHDAQAWNESSREKSFDVRNKNITSLKGIEHFTALTQLDCSSNQLTTLDVSKNTVLTSLICSDNHLTTVDVSNNTELAKLDCSGNQITELDLSNNTDLTYLNCSQNQLTALDLTSCTALDTLACLENQLITLDLNKNTDLTYLNCIGNQLKTLDVSNNTALKELYCQWNSLTTLDVSDSPALEWLNCGDNKLSVLEFSRNTALTWLYCKDNQLTTLDISKNTALKFLSCTKNSLTTLDVSKNSSLETLGCGENQLTSLDVSKNTALKHLWCDNNQLTTLDVSNNTALKSLTCNKNQLIAIDVSNNTDLAEIECNYNQLTVLDISNNTTLQTSECSDNKLITIDVSKNTSLRRLVCSNNQLTSIDLSNNTALEKLHCGNNQLTTLDVSSTNLNNHSPFIPVPLDCNMPSLSTLYLKTSWSIYGITYNRSDKYIHPGTVIEYKD